VINFKNKDEVLPSALIVFSVVVLLVSLGALLIPMLSPEKGLSRGRDRSRLEIQKQIKVSEESTLEATTKARPRLWSGDTDAVTAAVLAQLTRQSNQQALVLTAFRPQKPQALEGVAELPFTVQVAGSYAKVRAFVAGLDVSNTKLAVRSFQFASTDGATDAVTANVSFCAYVVPQEGGARG